MFGKFTVNSDQDHINVKDFRPDDIIGLSKEDVEEKYKELHDGFEELQERFYASKKYAFLIVFQGMDCSGKDGIVRKALSGTNPNGFYVENFKAPTPPELNHDYLWRAHRKMPKRGDIVVSNHSYYEDVPVTRVHRTINDEAAHSRFDEIHEFEKYLVDNDMTLLKFFPHTLKDFQQKKLGERLETPEKNREFSTADLKERCFWGEYQHCYSGMSSHCSTKEASWYVVPANHRRLRDYFTLSVIVKTLKELSLEFPAIDNDMREPIKEVRNNK